jgi:hypothetical protein
MEIPRSVAIADWPAEIRKGTFARTGRHEPDSGFRDAGIEWPIKPEEEKQKHAHEIEACGAKEGAGYRIAVDAKGHLTRCESTFERIPVPQSSCVCNVFKSIDWGAGSGDRRAWIAVPSKSEYKPTPSRESSTYFQVYNSDDPLTRGIDIDDSIRDCIVDNQVGEIATAFDINAEGQVVYLKMDWPTAVRESTRRCVEAHLAKLQFDCPLHWHAHVEGKWVF